MNGIPTLAGSPRFVKSSRYVKADPLLEAGHHIDARLQNEINLLEGELFLLQLQDQDSFLSLIWQESNPARLLTPHRQPRTLRDVANRLIQSGRSFEALNGALGLNREQHHPEWFEPCVRINRSFDFSQFGRIAVVPANDSERRQSPHGSFYLFDGMHKTLVLATRLLKGDTAYEPVEALYLLPRRG